MCVVRVLGAQWIASEDGLALRNMSNAPKGVPKINTHTELSTGLVIRDKASFLAL